MRAAVNGCRLRADCWQERYGVLGTGRYRIAMQLKFKRRFAMQMRLYRQSVTLSSSWPGRGCKVVARVRGSGA